MSHPVTPEEPTDRITIDVYELYNHVLVIELQDQTGEPLPQTTEQLQESVAALSACIAAIGLIPIIDGEREHPRIAQGNAMLETARYWAQQHNGRHTR